MSMAFPYPDDNSTPVAEETLFQIYLKHFDGNWPDLFTIHSYGEYYAELFAPYRYSAKNILEIGLFTGARLRIWEQYFSGTVYGIDCDDQPHGGMADLRPMIAEGSHNIHIMDAGDLTEVEKRFAGIKFDVIIEDSSHAFPHQLELYHLWKNYLSDTGIYIIEDVQDLDRHKLFFENMDHEKTIEIVDRRQIKNRYDDVLIVIK